MRKLIERIADLLPLEIMMTMSIGGIFVGGMLAIYGSSNADLRERCGNPAFAEEQPRCERFLARNP